MGGCCAVWMCVGRPWTVCGGTLCVRAKIWSLWRTCSFCWPLYRHWQGLQVTSGTGHTGTSWRLPMLITLLVLTVSYGNSDSLLIQSDAGGRQCYRLLHTGWDKPWVMSSLDLWPSPRNSLTCCPAHPTLTQFWSLVVGGEGSSNKMLFQRSSWTLPEQWVH